jgi:hypothetical protein
MKRITLAVFGLALCLVLSPAFARRDANSDDGGGVLNPIIWSEANEYGTAISNIVGYAETSSILEITFTGTSGRSADVVVDYGHKSWSIRDIKDSLSFTQTTSGWTLKHTQVGKTGKRITTFDAGGNVVSDSDTLHALANDDFAALAAEFALFYDTIPPPATLSCTGTMVLGGLAMVGESMLYAASWLAGPLTGLAGTPVYIAAMMGTNAVVLNACGYISQDERKGWSEWPNP